MAGFYKCVLNGVYFGKDNRNILWYRGAFDPMGGAFGIGGAVELADQIQAEVVPGFLNVKPSGYELQSIDIYPHDDALSLLYQLPYKRMIKEFGHVTFGGNMSDGPALAVNMHFNLEPTAIGLQALTAPKRGYIAVGPLSSDWIDDSGKLVDSFLSGEDDRFVALGAALSKDLTSILPPADFFPIRVSQKWGVGELSGTLVAWGFADVEGCSVAEYTTYRRSRRITG
jgi:hypothetical protein